MLYIPCLLCYIIVVDKEGKTTVNKKTILQHLILEPHEVPLVRDAGKDPPPIAEPVADNPAELFRAHCRLFADHFAHA
jgi:hypothetical protein